MSPDREAPYVDYNGVRFLVRTIANGYIVGSVFSRGEVGTEYYCANLTDVGLRVSAVCAEQELKR